MQRRELAFFGAFAAGREPLLASVERVAVRLPHVAVQQLKVWVLHI